jgi:hypothetical protein
MNEESRKTGKQENRKTGKQENRKWVFPVFLLSSFISDHRERSLLRQLDVPPGGPQKASALGALGVLGGLSSARASRLRHEAERGP